MSGASWVRTDRVCVVYTVCVFALPLYQCVWAPPEGPLSQVTNSQILYSTNYDWKTGLMDKLPHNTSAAIFPQILVFHGFLLFCVFVLLTDVRTVSWRVLDIYSLHVFHVRSGRPPCLYSAFKRLGTELVLGLFLNVRAEEQPQLFQEIVQLCTQHWHGRGKPSVLFKGHTHAETHAFKKMICLSNRQSSGSLHADLWTSHVSIEAGSLL